MTNKKFLWCAWGFVVVWGIFVFFGCVWGFAGVWGVAWLNFWRLCHFERSEKSIMNFVLAIHPAFFMDTSLTPQYDKKCPSLRAVFLKNGVAIYVDLGKFFWGLGFVGTLGKFVILSVAKNP